MVVAVGKIRRKAWLREYSRSIPSFHGHKTRLHIGQLVKDTSASETDHRTGVNVKIYKKIADAKLAKDFQSSVERETTYAPLLSPSARPSRQERGCDQEREQQGIQEIHNQIGEINEICKDLAVLVKDQGVMIEDIDTHIDNSRATTAQGRSQLAQASNTHKDQTHLWIPDSGSDIQDEGSSLDEIELKQYVEEKVKITAMIDLLPGCHRIPGLLPIDLNFISLVQALHRDHCFCLIRSPGEFSRFRRWKKRKINGGGGRQDSTQGVASGIFQINTGVFTFQRLVNRRLVLPEIRLNSGHKTRLHIGQLVKDTSASETDHRTGVNYIRKLQMLSLQRTFKAVLKEKPLMLLSFLHLLVPLGRNEAVIEEREQQGIQEIHNQIGEINEICKDLAVLVKDQGVMIDMLALGDIWHCTPDRGYCSRSLMLEKQEQVFWNVFINEYITWQSLVVGFKGVLVNVIEWVVWFSLFVGDERLACISPKFR
ncbi:hypothetical protein Bca4012_043185 [Brassica carinata]